MKKLQDQQTAEKNKRGGLLVGFVIVMLIITAGAKIIVANRMVEASDQLNHLDLERQQLLSENETLSQRLAAQESLVALKEQAKNLGFVPATKVTFIQPSIAIASK